MKAPAVAGAKESHGGGGRWRTVVAAMKAPAVAGAKR